MIARADASLMTLFCLQGCAETIHAYGTPEIQAEFLLGDIEEDEFRSGMELFDEEALVQLEFTVGLRRHLDGDPEGAAAFLYA